MNSPDLTVTEDDIVFLDLGPVFEEWKADFGRTFVVGNDSRKRKLCQDNTEAFTKGKCYFQERVDITCAELYEYAQRLTREAGWGIWQTHRGTTDRRVSKREDRRRQDPVVCPSPKSSSYANLGRQRPQKASF